MLEFLVDGRGKNRSGRSESGNNITTRLYFIVEYDLSSGLMCKQKTDGFISVRWIEDVNDDFQGALKAFKKFPSLMLLPLISLSNSKRFAQLDLLLVCALKI